MYLNGPASSSKTLRVRRYLILAHSRFLNRGNPWHLVIMMNQVHQEVLHARTSIYLNGLASSKILRVRRYLISHFPSRLRNLMHQVQVLHARAGILRKPPRGRMQGKYLVQWYWVSSHLNFCTLRHATPGSSRSGSESPHKKRRRNNGEGEESCPVPDCKHHFYQLSHLRRHIQDKDAHGGKLTEGEIRDFKKLATANSIKRKAEIKKAKKQKLARYFGSMIFDCQLYLTFFTLSLDSTVTGPASGDHDHDASGSESGPPPHKKQRKSWVLGVV